MKLISEEIISYRLVKYSEYNFEAQANIKRVQQSSIFKRLLFQPKFKTDEYYYNFDSRERVNELNKSKLIDETTKNVLRHIVYNQSKLRELESKADMNNFTTLFIKTIDDLNLQIAKGEHNRQFEIVTDETKIDTSDLPMDEYLKCIKSKIYESKEMPNGKI